jgi:hypothetical protein
VIGARAVVVVAIAATGCAKPAPQPQLQTSTLAAPAPRGRAVTPTRVCLDGNVLVFEHDCGCNDALVCRIIRIDRAIEVELRTDPTRPAQCDDCFPMVPARCTLPPATTTRSLVINTAPVEIPLSGCWTQGS